MDIDEESMQSKFTLAVYCLCHDRGLLMLVYSIKELQMELGQLCVGDSLTYQPLYEMVQVSVAKALKLHLHSSINCLHIPY